MAKKKSKQFTKSKADLEKEIAESRERQRKIDSNREKKEKQQKYFVVGAVAIFILIVGAFSITAYTSSKKAGDWDNFAKCLTENGMIMYGAMDFCKYTQHQAGMFGNSFKYINYKEYTEMPEVTITPTWYYNGKKQNEGELTFEELSKITGCDIY